MLIGNDKAKKARLPTAEQFLSFIPNKAELEWKVNDEDLVEISVPKFKSNLGKSLCRLIKRDETLVAKMDKIGSVVWEKCDGKRSVKDIFNILKKKFPKEENLDQRLFLFLSQMRSLGYVYY